MLMLQRNSRILLDLCLELVYGVVDADIQSYGLASESLDEELYPGRRQTMIKYKFTIGNQTIETLNLSDVPEGLSFETIDFEIEIEQEVIAPTLTVNEVIIDLVTRQVEVMSEEEKSELLTLLNG